MEARGMTIRALALACTAFVGFAWAPAARAGEVTQERLLNADQEQGNWLTHHKDYSARRFSLLDQINLNTVRNLKVAFTVALGGIEGGGIWTHGGLEGTPIVEDGFLYVTDGWGSVYKVDAHGGRGRVVWKMDPKTDHDWGRYHCLLRRGQPRRGTVGRHGHFPQPRRAPDRHRQEHRRGRLAAPSRRPRQGRGPDRRAAGGPRSGDHWCCRRRRRHSRLDRCHRPQDPEGSLAHLHHSCQRRTRL